MVHVTVGIPAPAPRFRRQGLPGSHGPGAWSSSTIL